MIVDISSEAVERPAYLICKYGGYYRPNSQGYTGSAIVAGRYTQAEAKDITHPNGPKGPRDGMTYIHEDEVMDEDWQFHRAILHGQAERIEELEAENGILRTEKNADAEAIGALREEIDRFLEDRPFVIGWNDGFEHGVKEALRTLHEQWRENSAVKEAAILALIEGDTND
ncbi:hypothetical protein [Sulfitobacter sp. 915]|uniref:hypothetical protein n=1 Tax=Sulfitobacter sp. 915 TaxID=3368558 RepID=UPI003745ABF5